jgi:hypothetical protein
MLYVQFLSPWLCVSQPHLWRLHTYVYICMYNRRNDLCHWARSQDGLLRSVSVTRLGGFFAFWSVIFFGQLSPKFPKWHDFLAYFFSIKSYVSFLSKYGLGYFFTNSFGHPAVYAHYALQFDAKKSLTLCMMPTGGLAEWRRARCGAYVKFMRRLSPFIS